MVVSDKNPAGWMPGPSPWACFQGQDFLGTRAEWPDRASTHGPNPEPHAGGTTVPPPCCTQPGLDPQCPACRGHLCPTRHSLHPGLSAPADFPWGEGHDLLRKWGPGQQAAWEQPRPAPPHPVPPRPALPRVQSCHGLWVSVGCPGLGGGWGPGGGAAPPPQIPPWPEPLQAVPLACGCP